MNDLTKTEPKKDKPQIGKGGSLSAIVPANLDETFRLSQALAMSGDMVPKHFQGKPEATMAAIIRGMELGLAPMQSLSNIAVINGRACLWGDAIPAIVQRHGHHIDVRIEGEGDNMTAIATLTRGDTGREVVREFSMADAKKAGLAGKQGPWQQYPKRMLTHRARTWAVRDGAADALMGLQVAEEVADYRPMRDVTPKETGYARLAQQAREKAATGAQEASGAQGAPEGDSGTPDGAQEASEGDEDDSTTDDTKNDAEDHEIDPESPAYQMGVEAAREGFIGRDHNPFNGNDEAVAEHANWRAGFDSVAKEASA